MLNNLKNMFKKLIVFLKEKISTYELANENSRAKINVEFDQVVSSNSIETGVNIIDKVVNELKREIKKLKFSKNLISSITLYVYKPDYPIVFENILKTKGFEEELRLELENKELKILNGFKWSFKINEEPPKNAFCISKGLFLSVITKDFSNNKASIIALKGKLQRDKYILDSKVSSKFNIGRGDIPLLDNNMPHNNFIVIKEPDEFLNKSVPEYELNRRVSRAHACIVYYPNHGFALKVYSGGCNYNNEGNRTRIFRDGFKTIDLQDLDITYPLKDNDKIELGKSVVLLFKELT